MVLGDVAMDVRFGGDRDSPTKPLEALASLECHVVSCTRVLDAFGLSHTWCSGRGKVHGSEACCVNLSVVEKRSSLCLSATGISWPNPALCSACMQGGGAAVHKEDWVWETETSADGAVKPRSYPFQQSPTLARQLVAADCPLRPCGQCAAGREQGHRPGTASMWPPRTCHRRRAANCFVFALL